MANTIAYQILTAIQARLNQISVANGYNNDLDETVTLGVKNFNPDQLTTAPVVSVYEVNDAPEEEGTLQGQNLITLTIEIEAVVKYDNTMAALKINQLWQDINRAVYQVGGSTLGGLALAVLRGPRSFVYPQPGGDTVAVNQTVSVQYLETYGNP